MISSQDSLASKAVLIVWKQLLPDFTQFAMCHFLNVIFKNTLADNHLNFQSDLVALKIS